MLGFPGSGKSSFTSTTAKGVKKNAPMLSMAGSSTVSFTKEFLKFDNIGEYDDTVLPLDSY